MNENNRAAAVDLTGREERLRVALQGLGRIAQGFSVLAKRSLPFLVRQRGKLYPQAPSLDQAPVASALKHAYVVEFRTAGEEGWGMCFLDAVAVSLLLEGALGVVSGPSDAPAPCHALTAAQEAVVGRIARTLARAFCMAVKKELALDLEISRMIHATDDYRPPERGLFAFCTVQRGSATAQIGLGLSIDAAGVRDVAPDSGPASDSEQMARALERVELEIVAELGEVMLQLEDVLSLKRGDVLRLSRAVDDSVCVKVAGVPKMLGNPIVSRGQLAIEIRDWHEV